MGYRSEVCLIVQTDEATPDNAKVWNMLWAEVKNRPDCALFMKYINKETDYDYVTGGLDMANQCLRLEWSDVKWYESFDSVQSVDAFVNLVSEYINEEGEEGDNKAPISLCYMQSGENDDDVSIRAEGETCHELGYLYSGYEIADGARYEPPENCGATKIDVETLRQESLF